MTKRLLKQTTIINGSERRTAKRVAQEFAKDEANIIINYSSKATSKEPVHAPT